MQETFSEYYLPDFEKLWKNAFFVFDTNVLLDLYRYSTSSSKQIIKLFNELDNSRLWLPYQVGLEFHRNKLKVKNDICKCKEDLEISIEVKLKEIQNEIEKSFYLFKTSKDETKIQDEIATSIEEVKKVLQKQIKLIQRKQETKIKELEAKDYVEDVLLDLFHSNVGKAYSDDELKQLYNKAEERYKSQIPPGYKDEDKTNNEYGDFIIWNQIIEFAKENKKSIIFVTNDVKEDWWQRYNGKTIGPNPYLRKEFKSLTKGKVYYSYTLTSFLEYVEKYLGIKTTANVIEEVKNTEEQAFNDPNKNLAYEKRIKETEIVNSFIYIYERIIKKATETNFTIIDKIIDDGIDSLPNQRAMAYVLITLFDIQSDKVNAIYSFTHKIFKAIKRGEDVQNCNFLKILKRIVINAWEDKLNKEKNQLLLFNFDADAYNERDL